MCRSSLGSKQLNILHNESSVFSQPRDVVACKIEIVAALLDGVGHPDVDESDRRDSRCQLESLPLGEMWTCKYQELRVSLRA